MLNKIENEINEFTKDIKEAKGCDEMINYVNSSYVASVKLLMFASSTFSLYGRVILFLFMASAGLLLSTIIGAIPLGVIPFFLFTFLLFALILVSVTQCRKFLIESIKNSKKLKEEA